MILKSTLLHILSASDRRSAEQARSGKISGRRKNGKYAPKCWSFFGHPVQPSVSAQTERQLPPDGQTHPVHDDEQDPCLSLLGQGRNDLRQNVLDQQHMGRNLICQSGGCKEFGEVSILAFAP